MMSIDQEKSFMTLLKRHVQSSHN